MSQKLNTEEQLETKPVLVHGTTPPPRVDMIQSHSHGEGGHDSLAKELDTMPRHEESSVDDFNDSAKPTKGDSSSLPNTASVAVGNETQAGTAETSGDVKNPATDENQLQKHSSATTSQPRGDRFPDGNGRHNASIKDTPKTDQSTGTTKPNEPLVTVNPPGDSNPAAPASTAHAKPDERRFAYMKHKTGVAMESGTMSQRELLSLDLKDFGNCLVVFLPRISELQHQTGFRDQLGKFFGIDAFYLTRTAYDSNGFFRRNDNDDSIASRFLIKELAEILDTSALHKTRRKLYRLHPRVSKRINESNLDPDIVSLPDPSNPELVKKFMDSVPQWKVRKVIARRMLTAESLLTELERHRKFRVMHPVRAFDWDDDNETDTQNLVEGFARSKSLLPEGMEKVAKVFALASRYTESFFELLRKLEMSQEPEASLSMLDQWMTEEKMASAVLAALFNVTGGKETKALDLLDDLLLNTFHKANCLLENNAEKPATKGETVSDLDITEIKQIYHWLFFFFWIKALPQRTGSGQILLCFDDADCPKLKNIIRSILSRNVESWDSPEKLLFSIVEQTVRIYDSALWGFRTPVRTIEKRRLEHVQEPVAQNSARIYFDMHELLRHLIHSQETLSATINLLEAALAEPINDDAHVLRFCLTFVKNMSLRAGAFVQRLDNEIALAYHVNNAKQLGRVDRLIEQGRNDGRDVAKFVGYATIVFLPGTFISGFFSMTFFGFDPSKGAWGHSPMWWMWFATTVPITLAGIFLFSWRHSGKSFWKFIAGLFVQIGHWLRSLVDWRRWTWLKGPNVKKPNVEQ